MNLRGSARVVCLSAESTEILYLLGEQDRIAGISGFATRPAKARIEKPKVSGFASAKVEKILSVEPDLALGFSNLQAEIAKELIQARINVLVFNQRSIDEILEMIVTLSRLVCAEDRGLLLIEELHRGLDKIAGQTAELSYRPRVYFEEWNDPLISGIRWVEELIEIAGGQPVFPNLRHQHAAKQRIVQSVDVIAANPQVIILPGVVER